MLQKLVGAKPECMRRRCFHRLGEPREAIRGSRLNSKRASGPRPALADDAGFDSGPGLVGICLVGVCAISLIGGRFGVQQSDLKLAVPVDLGCLPQLLGWEPNEHRAVQRPLLPGGVPRQV